MDLQTLVNTLRTILSPKGNVDAISGLNRLLSSTPVVPTDIRSYPSLQTAYSLPGSLGKTTMTNQTPQQLTKALNDFLVSRRIGQIYPPTSSSPQSPYQSPIPLTAPYQGNPLGNGQYLYGPTSPFPQYNHMGQPYPVTGVPIQWNNMAQPSSSRTLNVPPNAG